MNRDTIMQGILALLKKVFRSTDRPTIGSPESPADASSARISEREATITHLANEIQMLKDVEQMLIDRQQHLEQVLIERGHALESETLHRRRLEERLAELEVWEQLRPLLRGAFHALNNTLAGIVTYPELALRKLDEDSPLVRPLRSIKLSGEKAVDIVRDMHTLIRPKSQAKERVCLNTVVQEYLRGAEYRQLLARAPGIEVQATCLNGLCPVLGSTDGVTGILIHLVSAAVQSMPNGGAIRLATGQRFLDVTVPGCKPISEGAFAVLEIEDQGNGLAWEMLAKVSAPCSQQTGSGFDELELSMTAVGKMIKELNGFIDWGVIRGQRSWITLLFPIAPDQERSEPVLQGKPDRDPSRTAADPVGADSDDGLRSPT